MTFRTTIGGFALLPLLVTAGAIAPADAAVFCEGKSVTINLQTDPGSPATSGNDVILGTADADVINGLAGADTMCGAGGGDTINGGSGNDVILPGIGNDSVKGGDGVDTVSYSDSPGGVFVNLSVSVDQATSGSGFDTLVDSFENLTGSPFSDLLTDSIGNNTLKGGAGSDSLATHTGLDRLKGGTGAGDELLFVAAPQGITVDLAVTTEQATGSGKKTILGVERVVGTSFPDHLSGSDGANNKLTGGAGPDVLVGRGGSDLLEGQDGADHLRGGVGVDECDGGIGDGDTDSATGCENEFNIP